MQDHLGPPPLGLTARTAPERFWRAAALLLAAAIAGAGWPLILRTTAAVQFDYDEGWNAYRDASAAHLRALYDAPPSFDITNYPPLSFHLIGLLSRLTGDLTTTGRVVSLVSLGVICWVILLMTRRFVASRYAGACAALLFVLLLEVWMPNRIGVNDPQLLGMAFEALGFYVLLTRQNAGRACVLSAVLFALAVFTKQNLLALPLGAGMSLVIGRAWRPLLYWAAAGLLSAIVLLVATHVVDGPYFLSDIMRARAYRVADAVFQSGLYILVFLPYNAIAAVWSYRNRASADRRPLVLAWLAANALGFIFSGGDGTGGNMFFEAMVLDSVIVVVAYEDYFRRTPAFSARKSVLFLLFLVILPACLLPRKISAGLREWRSLPQMEDDFASGVSLLRSTSSPVVCENLLMCEQAGKASAFDPYFVRDQIRLGRLDESDIVDLVKAKRLGMVEIGDIDRPEPPARTHARFTKLFLQTLLEQYKITLHMPEFNIWAAKSDSRP